MADHSTGRTDSRFADADGLLLGAVAHFDNIGRLRSQIECFAREVVRCNQLDVDSCELPMTDVAGWTDDTIEGRARSCLVTASRMHAELLYKRAALRASIKNCIRAGRRLSGQIRQCIGRLDDFRAILDSETVAAERRADEERTQANNLVFARRIKARRKGDPETEEQRQLDAHAIRTAAVNSIDEANLRLERANKDDLETIEALYRQLESSRIQMQIRERELRGSCDPLRRSEAPFPPTLLKAIARLEGLRHDAIQRLLAAPWDALIPIAELSRLEKVAFTPEDLQLIQIWSGPDERRTPYTHASATSARAAELGLLRVYEQLYGHADDLSIQQVRGDARDWLVADVRAGGLLIDVKNARSARRNPKSYSEHYVKSFKKGRTGCDVVISAVLSPYHAEPVSTGGAQALWLGETSFKQLENLERQFSTDYLEIGLGDKTFDMFLPAWVFEYPELCYAERNHALAEAAGCVSGVTSDSPALCALALVLRQKPALAQSVELPFLMARLEHGGTRAQLFLHVLDRFCSCVLHGEHFRDDELSRLLAAPQDIAFDSGWQWDTRVLLGLDPVETVHTLISTLTQVAEYCGRQAMQFRRFRLRNANIFQGGGPQGWQTILAYCGGWCVAGGPTRRRWKCGNSPLFLGRHENCEACGWLICDECLTCSNHCPLTADRQERAAVERRGMGGPNGMGW